MDRRAFIGKAGAATTGAVAGAVALAAPAIAQSAPKLEWRLASSFPGTLDVIHRGAETFAKYVAEASDAQFGIQICPAGELFPSVQLLEKVQDGAVEMGHAALSSFSNKDPTFAFATAVPFGLNNRLQNAWWRIAGGKEVFNEFLAAYNAVAIPAGNTGARKGGWFRKEIKNVADLNGVKIRISGFGSAIVSKIGLVPRQIAGDAICPALERGIVDAAEWNGPYDDQRLGFYKVAPNYYYPGWWEGGSQLHVLVGKDKWESLPKSYQAILEAAAAYASDEMMAEYDILHPKALRELVAAGAKLNPFPQDVMETCFKASKDVYAELCGSNPAFRKVYETWAPVRSEGTLWWQVSEGVFDSFRTGQTAP